MKADEAHKIAEERIRQIVDYTIDNKIMPLIKKASEEGKFGITISYSELTKADAGTFIKDKMRSLGYNARNYHSDDDTFIMISW